MSMKEMQACYGERGHSIFYVTRQKYLINQWYTECYIPTCTSESPVQETIACEDNVDLKG